MNANNILIKDAWILQSADAEPFLGSILIGDGLVKAVGDTKDVLADEIIDAKGRFLAMPGLANAHTHSPMGLFRNLADDLPFSDWLFGKIIPAEQKLTEEYVYWGAMLGICEMIRSGVTCFADMYLHMDGIVRAVKETGVRANLSYGPITSGVRGNGLIVDVTGCERFIKEMNGAADGRIKTYMEIHSVYLFDEASITEAAALAKSLSTGIHIHLSESDAEIAQSLEKYGVSPIAAAQRMGVLDVPVIAAHCVKLNESDMAILREHKETFFPAHCPTSNMKLGNGFAPVPALLDSGMSVCIGTDGSASNNNLNMLEEMHIASLIHKGATGNPTATPASSVLKMATENGYRALGFGDGGILEGNAADIVLISLQSTHLIPNNDLKSALVYSAQASDVDTVIINGEIILRHGKFTKIDEELIKIKASGISKSIR